MTTPPDPAGVRRLVAAATKQLEVLKEVAAFRCDRDMEDGEKPFNILDYDAFEMWSAETTAALAAVRVAELERVVEWCRDWLPPKFHGEEINPPAGSVSIYTRFSQLIELRQALAALDAGAKGDTTT